MMGKYMVIKTGVSLRKIREELWKVHEAQILDQSTGEVHMMQMETSELTKSLLEKIGAPEFSHSLANSGNQRREENECLLPHKNPEFQISDVQMLRKKDWGEQLENQ